MSKSEEKSLLQPVDDDVRREVKTMVRTARAGAIGLLEPQSSWPSVSRIGLATDIDGTPVFPMSDLSGRTGFLETDNRASLLIGDIGKGDPLAHKRITLYGRVIRAADEDHDRIRARYLARHPKAKLYIDFKDFSLWRLEVERASFNGGFGRAFAMERSDIIPPIDNLSEWGPPEKGAREHMNDDHADAVSLYATGMASGPEGNWQLTGIDSEGIDLALGDDHRRVWFETGLVAPGDIKTQLVTMLKQVRSEQA
ncbi:MAG: DUF2470 domain-containing protein [Pseudomonadota bacterium]